MWAGSSGHVSPIPTPPQPAELLSFSWPTRVGVCGVGPVLAKPGGSCRDCRGADLGRTRISGQHGCECMAVRVCCDDGRAGRRNICAFARRAALHSPRYGCNQCKACANVWNRLQPYLGKVSAPLPARGAAIGRQPCGAGAANVFRASARRGAASGALLSRLYYPCLSYRCGVWRSPKKCSRVRPQISA